MGRGRERGLRIFTYYRLEEKCLPSAVPHNMSIKP